MGLNIVPASYDGTVDEITVDGRVIRLDRARLDFERLNKRLDEDQSLLNKLESTEAIQAAFSIPTSLVDTSSVVNGVEESCSGPNLCC